MIVLVVVILVFGTKKLRNLGSDLGGAMKGFKEGMGNESESLKKVEQNSQTIEGEVKDKTHTKT